MLSLRGGPALTPFRRKKVLDALRERAPVVDLEALHVYFVEAEAQTGSELEAQVRELLSLGAAIEIWGRRGPVLQEAAEAMAPGRPSRVTWQVVDIKDPEAVERAVAAMWEGGRPATHLINNVAGNFVSRTEDLSPRGIRAITDIVFHGTLQVTQAIGRRWIAAGDGSHAIVSITTTWGRTGAPFGFSDN